MIAIEEVANVDEIARLVCRDPRSEPVGRSMDNVIVGVGQRSIRERFVAKVALISVSASVRREEAKRRELISFLVRASIVKSSARLPARKKLHGFRFVFLNPSPRPRPTPRGPPRPRPRNPRSPPAPGPGPAPQLPSSFHRRLESPPPRPAPFSW